MCVVVGFWHLHATLDRECLEHCLRGGVERVGFLLVLGGDTLAVRPVHGLRGSEVERFSFLGFVSPWAASAFCIVQLIRERLKQGKERMHRKISGVCLCNVFLTVPKNRQGPETRSCMPKGKARVGGVVDP